MCCSKLELKSNKTVKISSNWLNVFKVDNLIHFQGIFLFLAECNRIQLSDEDYVLPASAESKQWWWWQWAFLKAACFRLYWNVCQLMSRWSHFIDSLISGRSFRMWRVKPIWKCLKAAFFLMTRWEWLHCFKKKSFTGACPFCQYVPLKPNPVGKKDFMLAYGHFGFIL